MTNNFNYSYILIWVIIQAVLLSCSNSKQLPYFQDLANTTEVQKVPLAPFVPIRLQADDQLQITISSTAPEASQFFNLMTANPSSASVAGTSMLSAPSQNFANVYAIGTNGKIIMPVLGEVVAGGLTSEKLRIKIDSLLTDYLKDAVVSVRLINFKVTVIGDVMRPVVVPVQGEGINVLEALGAAGDMTVFGKRYNVKVMRKVGGEMEISHLDMNSSKTIQSPFFQLRQNDVVYVEPNKNKGILGEGWVLWVPVITSILSLVLVAVTTLVN
jgi:polysaccharide export outer membrane protein